MKIIRYFFFLTLLTTSCVSHESLISFQEGAPFTELIENQPPLRIQPNDLLRIQVHSISEEAVAPFNIEGTGRNGGQQMMMQQQQGGAGLERFIGYYVDESGGIDFPVVGRIPLQGLTTEQAKEKIRQSVLPYVTDAVVNVRFLNFKVTVLGEVNAPGILQLTNQRVSLLDALGQAGDLTPYARRDNILITREVDGERTYARLNLQDYAIFQSPYFYLRQNDVIYVEPQQARVATVADPAQRLISYSSGLLSIVTLIIALTSR